MFYKFRKALATRRFYRKLQGVLDTPPVPVVAAPHTFTSMVGNNDVQMYILAIKSIYRYFGRGHIVAIVARDMPAKSRQLLQQHFPGIEIEVLEDVDVGLCQRGGCWERLNYILSRSRHEYVMQVDCDTLAFGQDLREVVDCVADNRAFTLSGGERTIIGMEEAAHRARKIDHPYVGIAAEQLFDRYPGYERLRYVRGSAGFSGFAKGAIERARIEEFHVQMERLLPDRWKEWGTEQCASNFAVANSPGSCVLPFPKYANYVPWEVADPANSSFLHFIGAHRFEGDFFGNIGARVMEQLNAGASRGAR